MILKIKAKVLSYNTSKSCSPIYSVCQHLVNPGSSHNNFHQLFFSLTLQSFRNFNVDIKMLLLLLLSGHFTPECLFLVEKYSPHLHASCIRLSQLFRCNEEETLSSINKFR